MNNNFSYGLELEFGDIDRTVDIPEYLGSWEGTKVNGIYQGAEVDVVNSIPPYRGVCTDPLGITCPVGGEINVHPTTTIDGQFEYMSRILDLFEDVTVSHMSHFHLHVHIPGLKTDLDLLKRFVQYCIDNQDALIKTVYLQNVNDIPESISNRSIEYLWSDGGRYISDIVKIHLHDCTTIEEVLDLFNSTGHYFRNNSKHGTSSIRTAVNISNLIKGETIEFRCFRPALNMVELASQLHFVEQFCQEAIKEDGMCVGEITSKKYYQFAPLRYNHINQLGWERTRADKSRGDNVKYSQVQFKEPAVVEKSNEFNRIMEEIS